MLYIAVLSLVSLFCSLVCLLLFVPENFLFITLKILSTLFLLEYISSSKVFRLNLLYHPCLKLDFRGIWSEAFISLFIHFLILFVSYALSV